MADGSVDPGARPREGGGSRLTRNLDADHPVERARLTYRRLMGLDRSGPPPPETMRDAPWRPWTIPNAITFARLVLVPVYLVLALSTDTGTDPLPVVLFGIITWGDYVDGIAARMTGQYSKLGALVDPSIDRLIAVAGVAVCWHFDLLPHWALATLLVRELVQVLYAQWVLRHGVDLKINWPGRLAVTPIWSGLFFAQCSLETLGAILLIVGLFLALWATALYIREGSTST